MSDLTKTVEELEAEELAEYGAINDDWTTRKDAADKVYRETLNQIEADFVRAQDAIYDKYADALNAADLAECPRCHGTRIVLVWDQMRGVDLETPCDERTYDGRSIHGQPVIDAREDAAVERGLEQLAWQEVGQ